MLLFEILLTVLIENWGNTMGWNNVQKNPDCLKQMSDAWKVNVVTSCRSAAATPIWGNTIQINQPCYQDHLHWRISTVRLCCIKPYSRCWSQSAGVYWPYSSDTGASIHYTNFPLWSSVSHTHIESAMVWFPSVNCAKYQSPCSFRTQTCDGLDQNPCRTLLLPGETDWPIQ